jgi:hypothetical protein
MAWISIGSGLLILLMSLLESVGGLRSNRSRGHQWPGLALGVGIFIQGVAMANHAVGSLWFGFGNLLTLVGVFGAVRDRHKQLNAGQKP